MKVSLTTLLLWSAGSIASVTCTKRCSSFERPNIVAHTGDPVGKIQAYNGANLYVSKPSCPKPKVGVLYITDVFGLPLVNNRLLTDSFARAGFLAVTPDLFGNDTAPLDLNTPGFNATEWTSRHGPDVTEPILAKGLAYLRAAGVEKIATAGYCYGGRYAFRLLAGGGKVDAAFAAHPSWLEEADIEAEVAAIKGPVGVAMAEHDELTPPERRAQIEAWLGATGEPYQVNLYGGTSHGFATRANVSDPLQKYAKETAFYQAVRWFDAWAGGDL